MIIIKSVVKKETITTACALEKIYCHDIIHLSITIFIPPSDAFFVKVTIEHIHYKWAGARLLPAPVLIIVVQNQIIITP